MLKHSLKLAILGLSFIIALPVFANGACSSEKHRQFDFWLGEWQVTQADGSIAGENTITSAYQGCVLTEKYRVNNAPFGESLNAYDRVSGKWHQTWMDKNGTVLLLSGGLVDGNMVLAGTGKDSQGKSITHRITWQPNSDGSVVQHWQFKHDGTVEWATLFKGTYSKRKS